MTRTANKKPAPKINLLKTQGVTPDDVAKRTIFVYVDGEIKAAEIDVTLRAQPITIGIPMDELMFSIFFERFWFMNVMPWDSVAITRSTYLPQARNQIHKKFLETGNEWLLMLDSDTIAPPNLIELLLEDAKRHNLKMVGGWYRKKGWMTGEYNPIVYKFNSTRDGIDYYDPYPQPGTGLESVDGAGAGCWLMHRDVAQAIGEKPYDEGKIGEDFLLCKKIKQAGFELWIDWNIACAHAGVGFV